MSVAYTLLPSAAVIVYLVLSSIAVVLCLVSLFAIVKTRRTVYSTKILSSGLLVYDVLFLTCSSISKFYVYEDVYVPQHLARGFHISAWIIVGSMALDRLWVISWPYNYLKIASRRRIRLGCGAVFILGLLQYIIVRLSACYATSMIVYCGKGLKVYLIIIFVGMPVVSFLSYGKVYRIVKQTKEQIRLRHRLTDFKGTFVCFLYLVNTAICSGVYLVTGTYVLIKLTSEKDGRLAAVADFVNLISCLVDPFIYVVCFRETRLEIFKLLNLCFPNLNTKLVLMRFQIYNIPTYLPKAQKLDVSVRKDTHKRDPKKEGLECSSSEEYTYI